LRAIKITKINSKLSNSNFGDFIKNEVNVLRILKSKHICRFIEVFEDPTQVAIVLDYIKGENLLDALKKGKKLSSEEVFYIIHILLQVLEEMNSKGFAHRDVKPSNIIIKRLEGLEDGDQL
jgi:serine/threonine protein kinase